MTYAEFCMERYGYVPKKTKKSIPVKVRREQHAAKMRERNAWLIQHRERVRQQPRTPDGARFAVPRRDQ